MTLRRTPHVSDPSRGLYERAYRTGDKIRQLTMELDTIIDSGQQKLITDDTGLKSFLDEIDTITTGMVIEARNHTDTNFTDFHRLLAAAHFAPEKLVMPILFGANTRRIQKLREFFSDGVESKSVELIDILYKALISRESRLPEEERKCIRGAIQEDTAAALLNWRQDGYFLALPSKLGEDMIAGVDLNTYFTAGNGQNYLQPTSIKSTNEEAAAEKAYRPDVVVLNAAQFNNLDLHISKLLLKRDEGHPGISKSEEAQIDAARAIVHSEFVRQVAQISTPRVKSVPSSTLLSIFRDKTA